MKLKQNEKENRGEVNEIVKEAEQTPAKVEYYQTISNRLGEMLDAQKDSELYNMYLYKKFSVFYKRKGLKKLANYFFDRSEEEKTHHDWITDRLEETNYPYETTPNIKPITQEWDDDDLIAPFRLTLEIERDTTASIYEIAKASLEEFDLKIFYWLGQRLIPEQHEEESISLQVLQIAERTDTDWLTKQDTILGQYSKFRPNPDRPTMDSDGDFDDD